jgi:hypothetical protein
MKWDVVTQDNEHYFLDLNRAPNGDLSGTITESDNPAVSGTVTGHIAGVGIRLDYAIAGRTGTAYVVTAARGFSGKTTAGVGWRGTLQ